MIDQIGELARSAAVTLTAVPGGGATVADYSGVPQRVTITAPGTEATFVVKAVADNRFEEGETVVLDFRRPLPSGVTAGSPDTAAVTIYDPATGAQMDREELETL